MGKVFLYLKVLFIFDIIFFFLFKFRIGYLSFDYKGKHCLFESIYNGSTNGRNKCWEDGKAVWKRRGQEAAEIMTRCGFFN